MPDWKLLQSNSPTKLMRFRKELRKLPWWVLQTLPAPLHFTQGLGGAISTFFVTRKEKYNISVLWYLDRSLVKPNSWLYIMKSLLYFKVSDLFPAIWLLTWRRGWYCGCRLSFLCVGLPPFFFFLQNHKIILYVVTKWNTLGLWGLFAQGARPGNIRVK